ncbi:transposase, partial [Xanthomonas perforans]
MTPHPCWLALGNDPIERSNAYRALLDEALSDELLASIRLHLQQQRALGHDAFR